VALHRPVRIDHNNQPIGFETVAKVPHELIGLSHFVIDVNQEYSVERAFRKQWVGGKAQPDGDVVEVLALYALSEPVTCLTDDILGQHTAAGPNQRRQTDSIIALAGANIGNRHAARHAGQPHDLLGLPDAVASVFRRIAVANDWRDITAGGREDARRLRLRPARGESHKE
jgi:hypothetical protein